MSTEPNGEAAQATDTSAEQATDEPTTEGSPGSSADEQVAQAEQIARLSLQAFVQALSDAWPDCLAEVEGISSLGASEETGTTKEIPYDIARLHNALVALQAGYIKQQKKIERLSSELALVRQERDKAQEKVQELQRIYEDNIKGITRLNERISRLQTEKDSLAWDQFVAQQDHGSCTDTTDTTEEADTHKVPGNIEDFSRLHNTLIALRVDHGKQAKRIERLTSELLVVREDRDKVREQHHHMVRQAQPNNRIEWLEDQLAVAHEQIDELTMQRDTHIQGEAWEMSKMSELKKEKEVLQKRLDAILGALAVIFDTDRAHTRSADLPEA